MSLLTKVKEKLPAPVGAVLTNCGGLNIRRARYAGRLLDSDLADAEVVAIAHSLILRNGVRKTTAPGRNTSVLRDLVGHLSHPADGLRVLDIGSSFGFDALTNYEVLSATRGVESYELGDLFVALLVNRNTGQIFDEDGVLLQKRIGPFFFAYNFEYTEKIQEIVNAPQALLARFFKDRQPTPTGEEERVPLFSSELRIDDSDSPFRSKRLDVFKFNEKGAYDLVICLHLLVPRYFSQERIDDATSRLARSLRDGGVLVTGSVEAPCVVRKEGERLRRIT